MATPHIVGLIALVLSHLRTSDFGARSRTATELVLASLIDLSRPGPHIRSGDGPVNKSALAQAVFRL